MAPSVAAIEATRTVRRSAWACGSTGVVVAVAGLVSHRPLVGFPLAIGMLLGAGNGAVARLLFNTGVPFFATSLARLVPLTTVAMLIGFAFGVDQVWLVLLGLGLAQLILAAAATWEAIRT